MHGTIHELETLRLFEQPEPRGNPRPSRYVPRGRAVPLVGIVRNPRSHRNKRNAPELAECSNILTRTPRSREALRECLEEFARRGIDFLVVDGGDGTVRDVLSCGVDIFGDTWPKLAVLPKGKTNALTVDLGLPNHWSLTEALIAVRNGNTVRRRPLRITPADGAGGLAQGFILGAGAFTLATEVGQEAHRRGAFNSFAVALTVLWGIAQTIFGRKGNPWRARTPMRIIDRLTGRELPHNGRGRADERFLAVATTFEKFPLGARPFGRHPAPGLKLGVIDWPSRLVMAMLPVILLGLGERLIGRNGAHRLATGKIELDLGGPFILDGEAFPAGRYILDEGPQLTFVVP
ncbi:diacylglycerol/lipid kinase family protein [Novosphingobium album (ex Liu et al. 2023)]|uniref:Diacylglycerol kinase family protein n=1 Tax=Novosphingobium album (ex Liu et al. 2023) TaxID=3031130 RepID=A0ABT5WV56_9SPHN|nr:diacylglycerol kinase family protein [Novosphingobium album (ex Liu et al. 2023)]MDE8653756.1 diacylglycerol kinase family protein [Novosphingobium album (ex Liu et al. 2023)]